MPDATPPAAKTGPKSTRPRHAQYPEAGRDPPTNGRGFRVVAIGASAGGLEACAKLLEALPAPTGMAFILVQHLDPTHSSLLVDLLAERTALAVMQGGLVVIQADADGEVRVAQRRRRDLALIAIQRLPPVSARFLAA